MLPRLVRGGLVPRPGERARRRRADAMVALEEAADEVARQEARLAAPVRGA